VTDSYFVDTHQICLSISSSIVGEYFGLDQCGLDYSIFLVYFLHHGHELIKWKPQSSGKTRISCIDCLLVILAASFNLFAHSPHTFVILVEEHCRTRTGSQQYTQTLSHNKQSVDWLAMHACIWHTVCVVDVVDRPDVPDPSYPVLYFITTKCLAVFINFLHV
jgi:hypothetical protein